MATTNEPWGNAPLTTEGLASLGHPLSLRDFNQDADGRYWRTIRGEKTYYPREWFDAAGTFTGTGTQPGDKAGQDDSSFFHQGTKWNWTTGQWENPINWANVIGLAAAGGVGAGIAAPAIGAALGGGGAAGGAGTAAGSAYGPLAGGYGAATTSAAVPTALAAGGGGMGTVGSILSGMGSKGAYDWILPAINTGLNVVGQDKALNANQDALSQQLASTKYATDAQSKSAADQLAFLRQQAGYDASVAEGTRQGNYDQWAAKQRQLGTVGQALGLPSRDIPAYVPLPAYGGGAPGAGPAPAPAVVGPGPVVPGGATAAPAASGGGMPNIQGGDIAAQVAAYFKARGVTPNADTPAYWAQKWQEFGARDPQYFNMRLSQADEFGGGAAAPGAAAPTQAPARRSLPTTNLLDPIAAYLQDPSAGTGQLQMPRYRPLSAGTVDSYLT